jgi:hypothetical protein
MIVKLSQRVWLVAHLKMLFGCIPGEPHGFPNPDPVLCLDRSLECNEIAASLCFLAAGLVSYSDFVKSILAC